jgi:hypothetical protein
MRLTHKLIEYDDISYAKELDKIEEKFAPLVVKCQHNGIVLMSYRSYRCRLVEKVFREKFRCRTEQGQNLLP